MKNNKALSFSKLAVATLIVAVCASVAGCSDDDNGGGCGSTSPIVVKLGTSATLGQYLTDAHGNALYFFSNDVAGQNTCTGGCATNWPVYNAGTLTADKVASGLSVDDFGSVTTPT